MTDLASDSIVVIMSDAERFSWVAWLVLVFFCSFGGSVTILVASIKYKAFRLNQVIVTIIEHIAVCDIMIALTGILIQTVSLIYGSWVFGNTACYIRAYVGRYITAVSIFLITAMTVIKFILVKFPLKSGSWSKKQGHVVCAAVWVFCFIVPISFVMVDRDDVVYQKTMHTCIYTPSSEKWKILSHLSLAIFSVIPMATTVIITALLFKHLLDARKVAQRTGSRLRWQGLVTVVVTAGIFCVSYIPGSVVLIVERVFKDWQDLEYFYRAASAVLRLNVMSNIFIYCFTVKSFRAFLRGRVEHFTSVISHDARVSTPNGEF